MCFVDIQTEVVDKKNLYYEFYDKKSLFIKSSAC